MSEGPTLLWQNGMLAARDDCDVVPARIDAADSWLVTSGSALALDLHRRRWMDAAPDDIGVDELDAFWSRAIAAIPSEGSWFPRVEARHQRGLPQLLLRLRPAPELRRSLVLATADGPDPRTEPWVKGPDLPSMLRLRSRAQTRGADEAVLLDPDGAISDGSTSAIAWWEGAELCIPDPEIPRVDSVTSRTLVALALALGVTVRGERAHPADLDGREIWALNALHGIRIVTGWVDGPAPAAEPGRLDLWRARLDALRKPLPADVPT